MNYIFGKSYHISIQFKSYFLDLKVIFISWLNNFDFNCISKNDQIKQIKEQIIDIQIWNVSMKTRNQQKNKIFKDKYTKVRIQNKNWETNNQWSSKSSYFSMQM